MDKDDTFRPHPKQKEFFDSDVSMILYGGGCSGLMEIKKMKQPIKIQNKVTQKEAFQWTGDNEPYLRAWIPDDSLIHFVGNTLQIYNSEEKAWIPVNINHFIIKGLKGEYYPCSPEIMDRSYEIVTE